MFDSYLTSVPSHFTEPNDKSSIRNLNSEVAASVKPKLPLSTRFGRYHSAIFYLCISRMPESRLTVNISSPDSLTGSFLPATSCIVFNQSLPFKNTTIEATSRIRQPGMMKVVCDTHAWMLGWDHVFDHPYFAVTNDQGTFSIPDLPAGNYVLKAWHEGGGNKESRDYRPGEWRDAKRVS